MKLGIGIVTSGSYAHSVPAGFAWSLYAMHGAILRGETPVTDLVLIRSGKFPTDCARNEICQQAIDERADALLFLDCDHVFDATLVSDLMAHDKDIVTARYHVKKPPYHPNLYLDHPDAPEGEFKTVHYGHGLFPVDRCGAGALLVKTPVLERMGYPWFRYQPSPTPPHDMDVSEDFYFCQRAQACGYTIWADWETEVAHLVGGEVTGEWHRSYLAQVEREIEGGNESLVPSLVSCGADTTLPSGHVIKAWEGVPA